MQVNPKLANLRAELKDAVKRQKIAQDNYNILRASARHLWPHILEMVAAIMGGEEQWKVVDAALPLLDAQVLFESRCSLAEGQEPDEVDELVKRWKASAKEAAQACKVLKEASKRSSSLHLICIELEEEIQKEKVMERSLHEAKELEKREPDQGANSLGQAGYSYHSGSSLAAYEQRILDNRVGFAEDD